MQSLSVRDLDDEVACTTTCKISWHIGSLPRVCQDLGVKTLGSESDRSAAAGVQSFPASYGALILLGGRQSWRPPIRMKAALAERPCYGKHNRPARARV